MINPINFRAASISLNNMKEAEKTNDDTVTVPIENSMSFKGAEALAAYNKVMIADTKEDAQVPAFKGDQAGDAVEAPSFRGEADCENCEEAK